MIKISYCDIRYFSLNRGLNSLQPSNLLPKFLYINDWINRYASKSMHSYINGRKTKTVGLRCYKISLIWSSSLLLFDESEHVSIEFVMRI